MCTKSVIAWRGRNLKGGDFAENQNKSIIVKQNAPQLFYFNYHVLKIIECKFY